MASEFEAVIGLEVHAQLATDSKLFCSCAARPQSGQTVSEERPNLNTCPVCTGQPGALPVLNRKAVEFAVKAGLATNCQIRNRSVFARKNYFYPDLPKGYQISQFDLPICENGFLDIEVQKKGESLIQKRITIQRIHMEEDAGKSVHMSGFSLVNLNRSSVPLIEIVSGPDMRSSDEAGAYLRSLYAIVTYLGVCDGNLQEGNFRCDANVSVRLKGAKEFGTRAEIKNVNSFRFVEKAIDYEIERQIGVILGGGKVIQETRTFDSQKGVTLSLRSKEDAHDYRYFPDPDLMPLVIETSWIETLRTGLPELPDQKKLRFQSEFGLTAYDAGVLTSQKEVAHLFEASMTELSAAHTEKGSFAALAKTVSNLISGEYLRLLNEAQIAHGQVLVTACHLADLARLYSDQSLSSSGVKTAIEEAWATGDAIADIVERKNLKQVSDQSALLLVVDQVVAANPQQADDYKNGKDKLLGFLVGQAMKQSSGKGNPALLQTLFQKKLRGN